MGGFSLASVPRPRAPFRRLRRPLRPFFYCPRVPLMPSHHIDLITFDLFIELDHWLANHDSLAQLVGHLLDITRIQIKLLGDLTVR